ncbi:hypothetical protein MHU86_7892 [Fragilaria crotonensis]|nr:hypothetical protein MHU86_7892 [Fragilaria crotonensis]
MTRILAETEQLVHNLDSHVMRNPEIHDSRSSPGVRPVSQDESSLKGNKSAASQKNATKNASSGGRELPQVDALLGSDDLEELLDVANTRVRATEGLAGKPLDEEEVIWIVDDVLVSRRKTEWCKIGGCTTDLQLSLANANSFRKLVVLMTTLLLQRKNRVAGGNDETGVSTLDSAKREPEAPRIASRHVLSVVPYTSENTVAKDTCAQASASSLDCSLTPSDEHAADDPLCDKENVDPVHGVEYTMEELNIVLSKAIAAHKHVDDGSTDSTPPSSPDVSFEDNYLSIDMIFEKFLELLPPGLGLDTSDLIESLPDDEQQYESFADTSTLIDAETTFDTKDGDTIEDTAQDNDVGAYAEMLSSLFSDANKLKEASLAAVAAAETSLLGPLFGHDNPVTSMFSSGEATGACDAGNPATMA